MNLGARSVLVVVLLSVTTMLGCSALNASQPAAQQATGLVATTATLDFGEVAVGSSAVRTNTIVNNSRSPLLLTGAAVDQSDFVITGQKLPLRLAPGARSSVRVVYSPQTDGNAQGRVVLASNLIPSSASFALRGRAIGTGRISLTPASVSFGNVPVGKTQTQTATLSNLGFGTITITHAAISGSGFALTGLSLPLTLKAKQTATVGVTFTPTVGGSHGGTISLVGKTTIRIVRRGHHRGQESETDDAVTTIATALRASVSGVGMLNGQIAVSPAVLALGQVKIGASQTQSVTLVNAGSSSVTLKQATVTGHGFRMSGLSFPLTLSPGQKKSFSVTFTPQSTGAAAGSIAVTSDAPDPVVSMSVSGIAIGSSALISNPSSLSFGSVRMGHGENLAATLTNSGTTSVTVSQASVVGPGFTVSGLSLPLTLAAGQSAAFSVGFKPQSKGSASGTLSFVSDASNSTLAIPLTATTASAVRASLSPAPSSLGFGNVQVGTPKTVSETLTNSGNSSITISNANVIGTGFTIGGLHLPATVAAGQSIALSVTFTPQSAGSASGSLSIVSDASNSTLAIPLTATSTAILRGWLNPAPSSLGFGNVQIGTPKTVSETLTNSGNSGVTISNVNVIGTGFVIGGLHLPATVAAGQSITLSVTFTPQSAGSASGSLSIVSNALNPSLAIPLSANGATGGALSTSDSSLDFSSVRVGGTNTLSETLTNSGGSSVTVTRASVTGTNFKISGLSLPLTLSPGQSFTFGAVFAPTTGGIANGSIAVVSDASNPTLTISMVGTATVPGQLAASPATLSFGSVVVGQSKSLTASLTASSSSITITNASMSTSEFAVSGLSLPLTLAAGKSVSFTVKFTPQSSGAASASAWFASNASNSSLLQSLTGSGTPATQHNVALSWNSSSSSTVVGYNIYRGATTGGPYSKINSLNVDTTYSDGSVQAGQTYFYVTTAVDATGKESAYSNQTQTVVPTP